MPIRLPPRIIKRSENRPLFWLGRQDSNLRTLSASQMRRDTKLRDAPVFSGVFARQMATPVGAAPTSPVLETSAFAAMLGGDV